MATINEPLLAGDAAFHLRTIYVRRSESYLADNFDPTIGIRSLNPLFRTSSCHWTCKELKTSGEDGVESRLLTCAVTFTFEFVYLDPEQTKQQGADDNDLPPEAIVARIVADISTDYAISRNELPTDDELANWAENNTILHAWPYWREYCHNTMVRMGLPVTIMPLVQRARPSRSSPEGMATEPKKVRRKRTQQPE